MSSCLGIAAAAAAAAVDAAAADGAAVAAAAVDAAAADGAALDEDGAYSIAGCSFLILPRQTAPRSLQPWQ